MGSHMLQKSTLYIVLAFGGSILAAGLLRTGPEGALWPMVMVIFGEGMLLVGTIIVIVPSPLPPPTTPCITSPSLGNNGCVWCV